MRIDHVPIACRGNPTRTGFSRGVPREASGKEGERDCAVAFGTPNRARDKARRRCAVVG
jgi:hypothetical protein